MEWWCTLQMNSLTKTRICSVLSQTVTWRRQKFGELWLLLPVIGKPAKHFLKREFFFSLFFVVMVLILKRDDCPFLYKRLNWRNIDILMELVCSRFYGSSVEWVKTIVYGSCAALLGARNGKDALTQHSLSISPPSPSNGAKLRHSPGSARVFFREVYHKTALNRNRQVWL